MLRKYHNRFTYLLDQSIKCKFIGGPLRIVVQIVGNIGVEIEDAVAQG